MQRFATTARPRHRLLIFARVPEQGRVKTRLADKLGDEKTLTLYRAMLADLLRSVGPSDENTEVEVMWTGSEDVDGDLLRESFGDRLLAMQCGATLGDRLTVAFSERILFHGAEKVIAIGSDDPTLSRHDIEHAFHILDSCEWVVGPADDGGYYLIGCRAASFQPCIFRDIRWGTSKVLEQTLGRIRERGMTLAQLPRRIDIDELDDLQTVASSANLPGHLAAVLKNWGWPR